MDYHRDTNANASRFYPSKGRIGKKMTGGSNRTAILRQKMQKELGRWIRLYKKKHGREPNLVEQRFAIDNPLWLEAEIDKVSPKIRVIIKHNSGCACKGCVGERPLSGGTWNDFLIKERERIHLLKIEEARIAKELQDAEDQLHRDAVRRRKIAMDCIVPVAILRRYGSGHVSAGAVRAAFGITKKKLDECCWAYGIAKV